MREATAQDPQLSEILKGRNEDQEGKQGALRQDVRGNKEERWHPHQEEADGNPQGPASVGNHPG